MTPASALERLASLKTTHTRQAAGERLRLLRGLERARLQTLGQVVQLHELLCFIHAYPDNRRVFVLAARMLNAFGARADLRAHRAQLENSGIAGTDIVYPFGFSTARWLEARWASQLRIEWSAIGNETALNGRLQLLSAWAERPVFDEPPIEGRAWLDRLRGDDTDAAFVVSRHAALPIRGMANDHLYDELGLTIRVDAGPTTPNRTRARVQSHALVTQSTPLRTARPDLARDIDVPPVRVSRLGPRDASALLDLARESMVTRSRDLYTFTAANLHDAQLVDCGDGLEFFCIGVEAEQRLLLDAVYGLLTLRNGVPIGYALFSALWHSSEVAYNVFESFRGGESAWIYGRMLATIRVLFGADTFTVDPYQLGHENAEGLDSGAWWFYYKMGFVPWERRTARLAQAEAAKVAARRGYRTSPATLRRLVQANVFFQSGRRRREVIGSIPTDRIGLQVTDYVNRRFGSDREGATEILAEEAADRLGVKGWRRFPAGERLFWERWAPLVALIPDLDAWTPRERSDLASVIRAKGGRLESQFVEAFDAHPRLGGAIASLARQGAGRR